jgi:hypothetical protein
MNRTIPTLLFIAILFVFNACSKQSAESDYVTTGLHTPLITGFEVRDEQGFLVRYVGNPNIKNRIMNESGNEIVVGLFAYPNPAAYEMGFHFTNQLSGSLKFYLVRATVEGGLETAGNFLGSSNMVSGSYHLIEIDSITDDKNIHIDVGIIPDGYYRAYLEGDNILLWDNIVVSHDYNPYQ